MTTPNFAHDSVERREVTDGRRRQLRTMLLNAADAARQGRRVRQVSSHAARQIGRAVRDRISTLLSTAA